MFIHIHLYIYMYIYTYMYIYKYIYYLHGRLKLVCASFSTNGPVTLHESTSL